MKIKKKDVHTRTQDANINININININVNTIHMQTFMIRIVPAVSLSGL